MNKFVSLFFGIILVVVGALALASNLLGDLFWAGFRAWPLLVVAAGLAFVLPPLLARGERGLGGLFVPGLPVLITGGILLAASLFNRWDIWAYAWPLEVLALGLGLLLLGIWLRVVWLAIPAFLVLGNGLALQFCALSGQWHLWSLLWVVEPLALGLAFLVVGLFQRSKVFLVLGLSFTGFALLAASVLALIVFSAGWVLGLAGPALLVLAGLALLAFGLWPRQRLAQPA
jgi:hypothetical protein